MTQRGYAPRSRCYLLGLALVLLPGFLWAQQSTYDQKTVERFAQGTLQKYIEYLSVETNYARFDFESVAEARRARLGNPYAVKYIGLRDLKAFDRDKGLAAVVRDPKILWFPVLVGSRTKAKLEVLIRDELTPGAFGAARSVKTIAAISSKMPSILDKKNLKPDDRPVILRIPALYAEFFHFTSKRKHYLVPAMANPGKYRLQNGEVYAAEDVLAWLSDYVQKVDENTVM